MGKKPLLATGEVVGDYEPLLRYWEIAREKSGELARRAVLRDEDFRVLERLLREIGVLADLLDRLSEYFIERIDPEVARRVYLELYGADLDPMDAARRIARIMAGWLVEAGETTGMLGLRRGWRGGGGGSEEND